MKLWAEDLSSKIQMPPALVVAAVVLMHNCA
jgi:hypothetical protein